MSPITPTFGDAGEESVAAAEACGCVWDRGTWYPCAAHPASCRAVVLRDPQGDAVAWCGVPISDGRTRCAEHEDAP